mgnify:CR=1 FL=1
MFFGTHVRIGGLLHDWLLDTHACRLPRQAFLYGNVKPDLERQGKVDRHLYANARGWISERLELLAADAEAADAVLEPERVGVLCGEICHHLSDACCRFHAEEPLYADFRAHFLYEMGLHRRLLALTREGKPQQWLGQGRFAKASPNVSECQAAPIRVDNLLATVEQIRSAYASGMPSFDHDIRFALQACAQVLMMLAPVLRALQAGSGSSAVTWEEAI